MTAQAEPAVADLQVSMQTSLFGAAPLTCGPVTADFSPLDARSSTLFQPAWVQGSDLAFEQLRDASPWRAMQRPMYDRVVAVPRLICTEQIDDLDPDHPVACIGAALRREFGLPFQQVGLNYYRTGEDSVAWHRDTLGKTSHPGTVVLVSLGSPRTLAMRRAKASAISPSITPETRATRRRWKLGHGDLLVMAGACQHDWEHCVPKESHVGPRISLAFRCKEAVEGPR